MPEHVAPRIKAWLELGLEACRDPAVAVRRASAVLVGACVQSGTTVGVRPVDAAATPLLLTDCASIASGGAACVPLYSKALQVLQSLISSDGWNKSVQPAVDEGDAVDLHSSVRTRRACQVAASHHVQLPYRIHDAFNFAVCS